MSPRWPRVPKSVSVVPQLDSATRSSQPAAGNARLRRDEREPRGIRAGSRRGAMSLHRGDPLPHLRDRRLHHLDRFDGAPPAGLSQAGLLPDLRLPFSPTAFQSTKPGPPPTRPKNCRTTGRVRCAAPNCGEDRDRSSRVPPDHGDQLLVQKNVYEFRKPRRWEVVAQRS